MPVVTDIRDNRGIVEIACEGVTVARVRRAHYQKCPLEIGADIDVEGYVDKVAAAQFADGYEAALTSLDFCARSEKEIANALRRKGYVEPCVLAVTQRLRENGLIDDARYAQRMAEVQSGKAVGLYAFKRRLKAKGISDDDAEEALSAFDDDQQRAAALEAGQRLWRKYEALPPREAKAKLSQALARRGFSWDAIESAIGEILEE